MGFHVFRQVVGSHEPLITDWTGKPLLSGVCSQMALELIAPGEALTTEQPIAHEGPFSRVPSQVCLQVGRFTIDLATARDMATVNIPFPQVCTGRA